MCVCVGVLIHVLCVLVYASAYVWFVNVLMHVLMCQYMYICGCIYVLIVELFFPGQCCSVLKFWRLVS